MSNDTSVGIPSSTEGTDIATDTKPRKRGQKDSVAKETKPVNDIYDLLGNLDSKTSNRWTQNQAKINNLSWDLKKQFNATKQLDNVKLAKLAQIVKRQMEIFGFKVRIDPSNAGQILIDEFPKDHPLYGVFQTSTNNSLSAKYVFDTKLYIEEDYLGTQSDNTIYLKDFALGGFDKTTVYHELGHRSEQIKSATQPYSLYNTRAYVTNADGAQAVVKIAPGSYAKDMNYDELNRHRRDLAILYSKKAETLVEGKNKIEVLAKEREQKAKLVKDIAEAVKSQSDYVLNYFKDPNNKTISWTTGGQVMIKDASGRKNFAIFDFDLRAFKLPPDTRRAIIKSPDGNGFTELVSDGPRTVSKNLTEEEFRKIREEEAKTNAENQAKARDAIISLAESNKKKAESALEYLKQLGF